MTATYKPTNRKCGIEIEFISPVTAGTLAHFLTRAGVQTSAEAYNHSTRSYWKIVTDASVGGSGGRGLELVSPPLTLAEVETQLPIIAQVLEAQGCFINRSCGLHVHWGVADYGMKEFKNLARLWLKYESAIDEILPSSRRGSSNIYCRENRSVMGGCSVEAAMAKVSQTNNLRNLVQAVSPTRYVKLNLDAYWRHGTVEFRAHNGTINATKILAWVRLTGAYVECGKTAGNINTKGIGKLANVLSMVEQEDRDYFERRRQALGGAA